MAVTGLMATDVPDVPGTAWAPLPGEPAPAPAGVGDVAGVEAVVAAAVEAAAGPAAGRGGEPGAGYRHCTEQKDTLFSLEAVDPKVCSSPRARPSSSLGEAPPETPPTPPGGQTVCHLSASVDTMGGLVGLLSRMRSRSVMVVALSLGTSCRLWMLS